MSGVHNQLAIAIQRWQHLHVRETCLKHAKCQPADDAQLTKFSSNGEQCVNCLSHDRGQAHYQANEGPEPWVCRERPKRPSSSHPDKISVPYAGEGEPISEA